MRYDGETDTMRSVSRFLTPAAAAGEAERLRRELRATAPLGSCDYITVRATRRKGRR